MSPNAVIGGLGLNTVLGVREFAGLYSPRVVLCLVLPRAAAQFLFLAWFAAVLTGRPAADFVVGAALYGLVLPCFTYASLRVGDDSWQDTQEQLWARGVRTVVVHAVRCVPYLALGALILLVNVGAAWAVFGAEGAQAAWPGLVVAFLPVGMGLVMCGAVVALVLGHEHAVLGLNVVAALILVASGVLDAIETPVLSAASRAVPLANAMWGVREGQPVLGLAAEGAVALAWLVAAVWAEALLEGRRWRRGG